MSQKPEDLENPKPDSEVSRRAEVVREALMKAPCSYFEGRCNSNRCPRHGGLAALDALVKRDQDQLLAMANQQAELTHLRAENERLKRGVDEARTKEARAVYTEGHDNGLETGAAWMKERLAQEAIAALIEAGEDPRAADSLGDRLRALPTSRDLTADEGKGYMDALDKVFKPTREGT